ncbi:MAG: helix-turn-helix transcriptional regulator [Clostridia bacterium]|nr:helix-turn-helix transcriptional regulator [Clostridia bacterium]MBR2449846.1 helix-turn-helix transcriptional regulator [Clostridia bacterium]
MNFGENFKKCRLEMHLSQKEVASKLGIHQSNISDWENDISRPEYENLIHLAEIYNVSLCQLLGIDENFYIK